MTTRLTFDERTAKALEAMETGYVAHNMGSPFAQVWSCPICCALTTLDLTNGHMDWHAKGIDG